MSKYKKIILGIFTFWPIVYMVIFFLFFLQSFFMAFSKKVHPNFSGIVFFIIFGLHFLTIILVVFLLIIYIINVFKNKKISPDMKTFWAVVLLLGNFIAMPIYWYLYIFKEQNQKPSTK